MRLSPAGPGSESRPGRHKPFRMKSYLMAVCKKVFMLIRQHCMKEAIELKRNPKVIVIEKDGLAHVIPLKPIRQMRGFARGADTSQLRDEDDRL
jgi:hypothetical protein